MDDVATKIIDILKKHMKEPRDDIGLNTALTDLKIESLDLAMIVFDIEDTLRHRDPLQRQRGSGRLQDGRLGGGSRARPDDGPRRGGGQGLTRGDHGLLAPWAPADQENKA